MSKRPKLTTAQRNLVAAFTKLAGEAPCAQAFILQAAEDAAPDEVPELSTGQLAGVLADFWAFAATRKGDAPVIRLAPVEGAPSLERLEILQDDAPKGLAWRYLPLPDETHGSVFHPAALRLFRALSEPAPPAASP